MSRQDGATGLVVLLAVALLLPAVGALLAGAADLIVTAARARVAADAAALAGMAASPMVTSAEGAVAAGPFANDSAESAARRLAAANGAELTRSDVRGWPLRYGVAVEAAPRLAWVRRIVGSVAAGATAAVRPHRPSTGLGGV